MRARFLAATQQHPCHLLTHSPAGVGCHSVTLPDLTRLFPRAAMLGLALQCDLGKDKQVVPAAGVLVHLLSLLLFPVL